MNYGFLVAGIGAVVLANTLLYWRIQDRKMRSVVFTNLNNAKEGEQFDPPPSGGGLHGLTALEIADDMAMYCDDIAGIYTADQIFPYVDEWMQEHGL